MLEHTMTSATDWDALLAARGRDLRLIAELEALPESALRAARLAQAHLVTGRSDFALQALARANDDPLVRATRLAVHAARYEYAPILEAVTLEIAEPRGCEARARSLHALALALWGEHRLEDAMTCAEAAMREAETCGMTHLRAICDRLRDDCRALKLELCPAVRERELRALLAHSTAEEERLETLIDLVQLMYRQGRYDESMRLSQDIPVGRQGRVFQAMNLIANRSGERVNWEAVGKGLDFGRLRAVYGLLKIDAEFILAGPEPCDEAPLTSRHVAEWFLSFAWAAMRTGQLERAAAYLEVPFVHRTEWDLRLIRATTWLEMLVAAPEFTWARCNALGMLEDALRLLREYVAPSSILVQSLPRAAPLAVALLTAAPGGCQALEDLAKTQLVTLDARGLTVNGLTRTRADSLVRVALGTTDGMNPQALRAARHRLKRLLETRGQAVVVHASSVLHTLEGIAERSPPETRGVWTEAIRKLKNSHGLETLESSPAPW
jgi:uncharacterized protein (UPF0147 family)/HPt (histidine-containing phosphotransfer) domain-containing protein